MALVGPVLFASGNAWAIEYSAENIEARVVDARSQSPIDGVIVVAHWQLEGGLEGGNVLGQVQVLETTTNASGEFKFPAWGTVSIPKGLPSNARLKDLDPELILFKPGYKFAHLQNSRTFEQTRGYAPYVRTSDWNHKTIAMVPLSEDPKEAARNLADLNSFLDFGMHRYSRCAWKSMPLVIESLHNYRKELRIDGTGLLERLIDEDLIANDRQLVKSGCGSPKQFFGGRLK